MKTEVVLMNDKCTLRLFTWKLESEAGEMEVIPVCPIHVDSRVRFRKFGTGVIVMCEAGTHLLKLCEEQEFETESEEARRRLVLRNGAASA
jgi:hypothetical protein